MKGAEKITLALLAIILLVIVLAAAAYFVFQAKGSGDILIAENLMRQCCPAYCSNPSTTCKTPSGNPLATELAAAAGIQDLDAFCCG